MGLDLDKLEKIKYRGSKIIAQCPACAEDGCDNKGEHLFISETGQFGCVVNPGIDGHSHRQRIFELAGKKDIPIKDFSIRIAPPSLASWPRVIENDILGHLGHIHSPHAQKNLDAPMKNDNNHQENSHKSVPNVPAPETD